MKNSKKIILGGLSIVGIYYGYMVLIKKVKIDRVHKQLFKKKTASDFRDKVSCENAGHNWGIYGMPGPGKIETCFSDETKNKMAV